MYLTNEKEKLVFHLLDVTRHVKRWRFHRGTLLSIEAIYLEGGIVDNRDSKSVIVGFNAWYLDRGTLCPSSLSISLPPLYSSSYPSLERSVHIMHTYYANTAAFQVDDNRRRRLRLHLDVFMLRSSRKLSGPLTPPHPPLSSSSSSLPALAAFQTSKFDGSLVFHR